LTPSATASTTATPDDPSTIPGSNCDGFQGAHGINQTIGDIYG
jgi:hypothetical protein